MMMQMLAAGGMPVLTDSARPPDADNPRGYFEFEPAKRTARDAAWLAGAAGKAVKLVHVLLPDLPRGYEYRVLFMQREMDEVLASQRAMLQRLGRRGADLSPERLAAAFSEQLRRVQEWLARQPHVSVLTLDYREVIEHPLGVSRRINEFLGGALDPAKMAAAVDPLLYRQREKG
jgi:nucleotide-binding universal stress UspA family protein